MVLLPSQEYKGRSDISIQYHQPTQARQSLQPRHAATNVLRNYSKPNRQGMAASWQGHMLLSELDSKEKAGRPLLHSFVVGSIRAR